MEVIVENVHPQRSDSVPAWRPRRDLWQQHIPMNQGQRTAITSRRLDYQLATVLITYTVHLRSRRVGWKIER